MEKNTPIVDNKEYDEVYTKIYADIFDLPKEEQVKRVLEEVEKTKPKRLEEFDIFADHGDINELCLVELNHSAFAVKGELTAIKGKPGVGKTAIMKACALSCIKGNYDGSPIYVKEPIKVLWVDTEHGKLLAGHSFTDLIKAGVTPADKHMFDIFLFKSIPIKDRLELLKQKIIESKADIVLIDQIFSFVGDVNSSSETVIIKEIGALAEALKISIVTVSHTNKSNDDFKGHSGAELNQISGFTFLVEWNYDPDSPASVTPQEKQRVKRGGPFQYLLNEHMMPVMTDMVKENAKKGELTTEEVYYCARAFVTKLGSSKFKKVDAIDVISDHFKDENYGKNLKNKVFLLLIDKGYILKLPNYDYELNIELYKFEEGLDGVSKQALMDL